MTDNTTRRDFVKGTALLSATALGLGGQPAAGDAATGPAVKPSISQKDTLPMGKIGKVSLSRLILGGNIMTAYSHSRDLHYVPDLMRRYHTPDKILETLSIAESHGINAMVMPVGHVGGLLRRYREEIGGKMRWIMLACPNPNEPGKELEGFRRGIEDEGADMMYIHGDPGLALIRAGRIDLFKKALEFIKERDIPAGVSTHSLEVIEACEKANLDVDFYLKTFHTSNYATAPRPGEPGSSASPQNDGSYDNSWCRNAQEVSDYMKTLKKPWMAFKVMAAGAIPPREAFQHAFANGADFVLAGMFDWQIAEDVQIANEVISTVKRLYPWRA